MSETLSLSASSRWVMPFARLSAAMKLPMVFFSIIILHSGFSVPDRKKSTQNQENISRIARNELGINGKPIESRPCQLRFVEKAIDLKRCGDCELESSFLQCMCSQTAFKPQAPRRPPRRLQPHTGSFHHGNRPPRHGQSQGHRPQDRRNSQVGRIVQALWPALRIRA